MSPLKLRRVASESSASPLPRRVVNNDGECAHMGEVGIEATEDGLPHAVDTHGTPLYLCTRSFTHGRSMKVKPPLPSFSPSCCINYLLAQ